MVGAHPWGVSTRKGRPSARRRGRELGTPLEATRAGRRRRFRSHAAPLTPLLSFSPFLSSTTRYQAHDADGIAGMGDIVRLAPVRPMSKTKRFAVAEIIKKGD